ncbi:MAG: hypothetical protein DMG41_34235 [Acidobacteria bacterium]|nr:MAG: hypothetical protein DMG42_32305 [Acidobacteriota bacterium]PYT81947.1 MAG: hypothetical protein DMG41_34235 [Acidobacteriota bacterium]
MGLRRYKSRRDGTSDDFSGVGSDLRPPREAAKVLGISRRTLTRKLKKYEVANALEAVAAG